MRIGSKLVEGCERATGIVLAEEGGLGRIEASSRAEDALVAAHISQKLASLCGELSGCLLLLGGYHASYRTARRT